MDDKVPCCMADAARKVRRITLSNGVQIGIVGLDSVLFEVKSLGRTDELGIKAEMLGRVKANNYIPTNAEADYAEALYREYIGAIDRKV